MKILVITPRYTIAGVPLAQIRFARALASQGHHVEIMIGYIEQGYNLPDMEGIKIHDLNKPNVRSMFWSIWKFLLFQKPDLVFSAEDHLTATVLIAAILSLSKAKISGSSRVTPYDTYSNIFFSKRWFLKKIIRAVMWRADVLSCVSEDMVAQYKNVFKNPPHVCIYNIVDDKNSRERMLEPLTHEWLLNKSCPVIIGAGKLAEWKGFSDLILAINECVKSDEVRLIILGDGPLRDKLQDQIDSLKLNKYISLLGYVENPLNFYFNADIFVLSSRVEGLPNVLVEAMMCGCTAVSTDCPTGPRELLADGKYGYLVPVGNPALMAEAIITAISKPISSENLNQAIKPFEETAVIKRHFEMLGIPEVLKI